MTKFDQLEKLEAEHVKQRNFWNLQSARFHKKGDDHSTKFAIGNKNKAIAELATVRTQLAELKLFGSATR